jgi:hypothetical protein
MNNAIRNKFLTWLVVTLLVANAGTILFFWINRPEKVQREKGSPREFLVRALELDSSQLDAFQALIEEHQASARPLKNEIRSAKENLFQLLKQPIIPDPEKMKAVQAITDKTKALELLNLEHFQQLRALCNEKQKKKFDGLLDQLAGLMAESRAPQGPPPGDFGHLPPSAADTNGQHPPINDQHRPPPPGEGHPPPHVDGHRPPPPPGEGHPPPHVDGHRPPPPGEGHPPPPGEGHHPKQGEGHPPHGGKRPLAPPDQQ